MDVVRDGERVILTQDLQPHGAAQGDSYEGMVRVLLDNGCAATFPTYLLAPEPPQEDKSWPPRLETK